MLLDESKQGSCRIEAAAIPAKVRSQDYACFIWRSDGQTLHRTGKICRAALNRTLNIVDGIEQHLARHIGTQTRQHPVAEAGDHHPLVLLEGAIAHLRDRRGAHRRTEVFELRLSGARAL